MNYRVDLVTLQYGGYIMSGLSSRSDDELLSAFVSGDLRAYENIYDRYWPLLFRHARKMLQDNSLAKDVVQEVFTTLWQKRAEQVIRSPLAAYLYSATRNKVLDLVKHSKVEEKYLHSLKQVMDSGIVPPDQLYIERELYEQIETEILNLPPKMREIFLLSRKDHKSHKEIADQLGISDKTVKKQVSNSLRILKGKLGDSLRVFLILF
ncbi:RNA polymerase sigma factor [Pedobacter sp. PWIIR3]